MVAARRAAPPLRRFAFYDCEFEMAAGGRRQGEV